MLSTRTRTLLFTDIVRSTELLGGLGQHHGERLRLEHFAALREQAERHNGTIIKNLGDGVMATFECARDALECGVAMQIATALSGRCRATALSIRVGIASGDVQIDDADCFGTPVVEASRVCAAASARQVLVAESTRLLARSYRPLAEIGPRDLKGLAEPTVVWEATWSETDASPVRAILADDSVLLREGVARVLEARGIEVIAQAGDADELLRLTAELRPDLAIVDVRMPPTGTDEGLKAAEQILTTHPSTSVLLLSQDVDPHYAERLLAASRTGVGYLLKERVSDLGAFTDAARRVANGGVAFEAAIAPSAVAS
jgi:class 3 adenylate cyclase/CheY-like chemotaxis protein